MSSASLSAEGRAADRPVTLPVVAVEPHVLVLRLPLDQHQHERPESVVTGWLAVAPELSPHRAELGPVVTALGSECQVGEVAAFLAFHPGARRMVGGTSLLTLELLDPMPGTAQVRADRLTAELQRTADALGHADGLAEVSGRTTTSGVPAVRLRFLAIVPPVPTEAGTPMVEACRWLYPVPGHPDLAWSLVFQTTDIEQADQLVEEFDRMATSLAWAER